MASRFDRIWSGLPFRRISPESGRTHAENRQGQFRSAGAEPAGQANDLALADVEGDIPVFAAPRQASDRKDWLAGGRLSGADPLIEFLSGHELRQADLGHALRREGSHVSPVAQNRYALADVQNLGKPVADENDGDVLGGQPAHDLEQRECFRMAQGRGRFIHEHEAGIGHERTGDGDQLALCDGERSHRPLGVDADPELVQHGTRHTFHLAIIDEVRLRAEVAFEGDVLSH